MIIDTTKQDVLVIGGGFYGVYIAVHFAKLGRKVLLVESSKELLGQASYVNQARVHGGYHYPRSVLTGLRSRISYPKFINEFRSCVNDSFKSYYFVGKNLSKVTSQQFISFCERIKAPCVSAPDILQQFADDELVDGAFQAEESVFDAVLLRKIMIARLAESGVQVHLNTKAVDVIKEGRDLLLSLETFDHNKVIVRGNQIFNCTYAGLNRIHNSKLIPIIPLQHQLTEMCLVKVPEAIKDKGFTMMCGPFFSITPFPSTTYHALSHVRYTPHSSWVDTPGAPVRSLDLQNLPLSNFSKMQKDASRYMPLLQKCEYVKSIWAVKSILPSSQANDSRPILFQQNHGLENFHCVLGGKIDNIYDVIDFISSRGLDRP